MRVKKTLEGGHMYIIYIVFLSWIDCATGRISKIEMVAISFNESIGPLFS